MAHLVMHRGETRKFTFTIAGTAEEATLHLLAKHALADADAEAVVDAEGEVTDADAGTVEVTVPSADTASLPNTGATLFYGLCRVQDGLHETVSSGMLIVRPNVDATI